MEEKKATEKPTKIKQSSIFHINYSWDINVDQMRRGTIYRMRCITEMQLTMHKLINILCVIKMHEYRTTATATTTSTHKKQHNEITEHNRTISNKRNNAHHR